LKTAVDRCPGNCPDLASQGRADAAEEQLLEAQQIAPNNRDIQKRLLWLRRQQDQGKSAR